MARALLLPGRQRQLLPLSVVECTNGHALVGRFMGQCIPLKAGEHAEVP